MICKLYVNYKIKFTKGNHNMESKEKNLHA